MRAPTEAPAPAPERVETWPARLAWLLGGCAGLLVGFGATWALEAQVLRGHVADPTAVAARASSVIVGGAFLAGALAGHGFGAKGGASRRRLLASAAGTLLAVGLWALLVLAR